MSNDLTTPYGEGPMAAPRRGRRKLWVAAGVAGLTGVVGLAAVGGLAARDQKSGGAEQTSNTQASAPKQNVSDTGKAEDIGGEKAAEGNRNDKDERHGKEERGGKGEGRQRVKEVPCDTDKLIDAITQANRTDGATLKLAEHCTYTLTRHDQWGNGLPRINQPITLKGDKTRIERDSTAKPFRILNVGPGGELTLKGLTIKGGQLADEQQKDRSKDRVRWGSTEPANGARAAAPEAAATTAEPGAAATPTPWPTDGHGHTPTEGAGLLVHQGGSAVVEHSVFVQNHAAGDGGAIANFGTTRVAGTLIERNSAGGFGGGVFNGGVLKIEDSELSRNSAEYGGGGLANGSSSKNGFEAGTVFVVKSEVSHNRTAGDGGGLADNGGTTSVSHSQITGNTAGSDVGGVLADTGSQLTLTHTLVARNSTEGRAGGVGVAKGAKAVIEHSLVKENVSDSDGGGLFTFGLAVLRDTEVLGNQAVGEHARAGGIFNDGGKVSLIRTKVAANFATKKPGGIYTTNDRVDIDSKSTVVDNRPTNCLGSPVVPDRCFG
ncbi:right-handed parallel beta-helix repeat-containing protein [Micromonospora sp. NPDC002389]|uniref:right-handed parallel beta-helix repeat-containing protein n=1 Tax=Micromonospora sp. NPDC002389 TaxID=3154272 RepID=UPI00332CF267